jgi:hypothetical protein
VQYLKKDKHMPPNKTQFNRVGASYVWQEKLGDPQWKHFREQALVQDL